MSRVSEGAECTFEENATLGAQMDGYPGATKLSVDPQRILTEAARRISTCWLPTGV